MKIKNKDLGIAKDMLMSLTLKGATQRLRTRFCKKIEEHELKIYRAELNEIIEKYAEKDEDGKVIMQSATSFKVPPSDLSDYLDEVQELENEFMEFQLTDENKKMLLCVADLVLDEDLIEVSGVSAFVHDDLCEEFESVIEHYNKKE